MRSKATNYLQIIVLIVGIIYMAIGAAFFTSPISMFRMFVSKKHEVKQVNVNSYNLKKKQKIASANETLAEKCKRLYKKDNSVTIRKGTLTDIHSNFNENWIMQVKTDEILAPLYYFFRVLSALLFIAGFAMILPLFDPLKYRGLVYFNAVIFPLLGIILFSSNALAFIFSSSKSIPKPGETSGHALIMILWLVLIFVLGLGFSGLMLTRKLAKKGIE